MQEKSTSVHTILRLVIRELRQQLNIQQAHLGQLLGKSSSTWSKVESGEQVLSLDHLFTVCHAMQVPPAAVMQTTQNYIAALVQLGWYVATHGKPLENADDKLAQDAESFYAFMANPEKPMFFANAYPVLSTPWPYMNHFMPIDVIRWATDESWRASLENPQQWVDPMPGKF